MRAEFDEFLSTTHHARYSVLRPLSVEYPMTAEDNVDPAVMRLLI